MPKLGVTLLLLLGLALTATAAEDHGGDGQDLRHLLVQECGSCHGLRLHGGLGSPLTPDAISERTDEYLKAVILRGVAGTAMPPWAQRLTEEEASKLVQLMREGVE